MNNSLQPIALIERLERGERCWAAEIVLRSFGLALLGLCAAAVAWLYRSVHQPPHEASALELFAASISIVGWSLGWSFLVVGPGLFKLVAVPGRCGTCAFNLKDDGEER